MAWPFEKVPLFAFDLLLLIFKTPHPEFSLCLAVF
jgi:hypothetical protein